MPASVRTSFFVINFSLAAVFLWFGIDKFVHPFYWINAWVPQWFLLVLQRLTLEPIKFMYLNGAFEVLVGVALISGVLRKFFCLLGMIFVAMVMFSLGVNEILMRDIAIFGGLLAIFLWPEHRYGL